MNLFVLMWTVYSVTLMRVETISIANYMHNVAILGMSSAIISFALAFLVAVRKSENKFLWWLFSGYLIPGFTPSDKGAFIKDNLPKLIIYLGFFVTLFLTSAKVL